MWHRNLNRETRIFVLLQLLGNQSVGYKEQGRDSKPTLLVGNVRSQFQWVVQHCDQQFVLDEPLPGRFQERIDRAADMRQFRTLTREAKEKLACEILSDMLNIPHLSRHEKDELRTVINGLLS